MSVQVSYKKQIMLGFILLGILFSVVEGISQILWHSLQSHCELEKTYFESFTDDFRKKLCSDYKNIEYTNDVIRRNVPDQNLNTLSINSFGFRGHEISRDKNPDHYRIIMVGGSTTFGVGATNDATTVPALLESMIRERTELNVEVINAGVIAARSAEEVFYIKNDLMEFQPDLIIVFDGYNDAFNIKLSEYVNSSNRETTNDSLFIEQDMKKYFKFLAFPNVVYQYTHDSMQISYLTEELKNKNVDAWVNRWNEICHLGNMNEFDLLVILQPMVGTSDRKLTSIEEELFKQQKTKKTLEFLNALGDSLDQLQCDSADLRNTFDEIDEQIYFSPVHTGDFGNKIIAEKIYGKALPIILENLQT